MNRQWTNKCQSKEEKEEFTGLLLSYGTDRIFEVLTGILEDKLKTEAETKKPEYDTASWAYLQADKNGAARALRDIIKLLKVTKED